MGQSKNSEGYYDRGSEPPAAAFIDPYTKEVDDAWLEEAGEDDQVSAMVHWFHARFWDPANETPYMSSEGGYIWIRGGPYEADDQLRLRFEGLVSEEALDAAVEAVEGDGIYEWAPTHLTYFNDEEEVYVDEAGGPQARLTERVGTLVAVLELQGNDQPKKAARNLVYVGLISAFETYLWETMAYWIKNDPNVISNLITQHPVFRDRKISVGDIYKVSKGLEAMVDAHLQQMVWHRWDQVSPLMEIGLDIDFPATKDLVHPTKIRHDIVHRSGHDLLGIELKLVDQDIHDLAGLITGLAETIDQRITATQATQSYADDL